MRRLAKSASSVWLAAVLVLIWWLLSASSQSPFFPPLSVMLQRFQADWLFADLGSQVLPSMRNLFVGLALAVIIGVSAGYALALMPRVEAVVDPFIQFMRAMPAIAMVPFFLVIAGIGDLEKVLVIGSGAVWPILLSTVDGVRSIDPEIRRVAHSFQVSRGNLFLRVLLPGAVPSLTAGFRTSLSVAVVLMVGSELYGASHGIGYFVLVSESEFKTADMWAGVILLGVIGYLLNVLYLVAERRLLRWRPTDARRGQAAAE